MEVKSVSVNIWYSSMFSSDADMTAVNNENRDLENMFVLASDYRVFLMTLL